MNAPDMHMATLAAHEDQAARDEARIDADNGRTYARMLTAQFERAIASGAALRNLDHDTEAVYSAYDELSAVLAAYRSGESLLEAVEALYDGLKERFTDWRGEEIRERAEAAILAGDSDAD